MKVIKTAEDGVVNQETIFLYCQMQIDGKLNNGVSTCQLSKTENWKIILTENFEWKSHHGEFGTNIF